jgi:hypothetical protein
MRVDTARGINSGNSRTSCQQHKDYSNWVRVQPIDTTAHSDVYRCCENTLYFVQLYRPGDVAVLASGCDGRLCADWKAASLYSASQQVPVVRIVAVEPEESEWLGLLVGTMTLMQIFSEHFSFPCLFSFY